MSLSDFRIVADSSSDMLAMEDISFKSAPLKIITDLREYTDNDKLDVQHMVNDLLSYKGKTSTACPGPGDWEESFGDAKYVFCIAITSSLSGSYNSACIAAEDYQEKHPDRKVLVIDSMSTGPEMQLIAEKLAELINKGLEFEEICLAITEYKKHTGLVFMLESMRNLANNGRVNPIIAKASGFLGIRITGKASNEGKLEILDKCRGESKALISLVDNMKNDGLQSGKIIINHCFNQKAAEQLKRIFRKEFRNAVIKINPCRGLTSFYAERGGLMIGFEKSMGV